MLKVAYTVIAFDLSAAKIRVQCATGETSSTGSSSSSSSSRSRSRSRSTCRKGHPKIKERGKDTEKKEKWKGTRERSTLLATKRDGVSLQLLRFLLTASPAPVPRNTHPAQCGVVLLTSRCDVVHPAIH